MKKDKKTKDCKTRLTDKDFEMLNYICNKTGKSKSEIIRTGIKYVYAVENVVFNNDEINKK